MYVHVHTGMYNIIVAICIVLSKANQLKLFMYILGEVYKEC